MIVWDGLSDVYWEEYCTGGNEQMDRPILPTFRWRDREQRKAVQNKKFLVRNPGRVLHSN